MIEDYHAPAGVTKGWKAALDAQMEMTRLWASQTGRQFAQRYIKDKRENYVRDRDKPEASLVFEILGGHGQGVEDFKSLQEGHLFSLPLMLRQSEPIWVESDIVDLIDAASVAWEPEPLIPDDLLCDRGFVLLEKPLSFIDFNQKRCDFRAFSWFPAIDPKTNRSGVFFLQYSHVDDVDDYLIEDPTVMRRSMAPYHWSLLHAAPWWFNKPFDREGYDDAPISALFPITMQVFFRLAQQQILLRDRVRPDRPYRRNAKRMQMPEDLYVTVIKLRQPKGAYHGEPEGEPVNWSHRWIVGGHWRNQWYPSLKTHRKIWISPYVKGPEGKELILRDLRAWEFTQ